MPIGSEDIYIDFNLEDAIYEPMLLGNLAAPPTFRLAFQRLWMTSPCLGMYSMKRKALAKAFGSFLPNRCKSNAASGAMMTLYGIAVSL